MSRPPLTVVITSYNREAYLGASIESVLASRFESYELLVIDNRSTDDSVAVAESYAKRDDRIKVVVNERNLGQFGNRNRAIDLVETPYLKYHDSDDLMYPHCLGTMFEFLDAEPDAGFALSAGRSWPGGPCPMLLTPKLAFEREYLGHGLFFCGPSGALFRTEVLRSLGGFPDGGSASDYRFWLSACARTNVLLVPADLFWYRIHPDQEYQNSEARRDYAAAEAEAWRALQTTDCPLTGDDLARAKRNCLRGIATLCSRDVRAGRWSTIGARLHHARIGLSNWIRFFPRASRSALSGTPLDREGDYVVPAWVRQQKL